MENGGIHLRHLDGALRQTPATLVTDCKGLYDSVRRVTSARFRVDDRRTTIEALALRQSLAHSAAQMRWVHSEAMPAEGLTKGSMSARTVLFDFIMRGYWRIVKAPEGRRPGRHPGRRSGARPFCAGGGRRERG